MIHFLRKIRYSLIQGDNMKKYVFYAVGEVMLVVIGILIALQIDDWNENRKENNLKNAFLLQLKRDLIIDSENIIFIIDIQRKKNEGLKILLDKLEKISPLNAVRLKIIMI